MLSLGENVRTSDAQPGRTCTVSTVGSSSLCVTTLLLMPRVLRTALDEKPKTSSFSVLTPPTLFAFPPTAVVRRSVRGFILFNYAIWERVRGQKTRGSRGRNKKWSSSPKPSGHEKASSLVLTPGVSL